MNTLNTRRTVKLMVTFIVNEHTEQSQKNLLLGTPEDDMQIIVRVDETGIVQVEIMLAQEEEQTDA